MFRRKHDQLRAEMQTHLEEEIQLNRERGMSPEQARAAALQRFGNTTLALEESRAVWIPPLAEQTLQDLHYALRTFRRNPVFSLAAVLVIAAGIGASSAVFSFLDTVFVRKLPYAKPQQLVTVGIAAPILDYDFLFAGAYLYLRESPHPFIQLTSWTGTPECDVTEDRPQSWICGQVESTFLSTLGIEPLIGRNFADEEDRPNAPKVALLSFAIWHSRYGADPHVLGRLISIDGSPVRIIGVLPPDFEFPSLAHIDMLVPQALGMAHPDPQRSGRALHVLGRIAPGLSPPEALVKLQPFFRLQLANVPPNFRKEVHPAFRSLRDYQVGSLAKAGRLLAAATAAILLIVVANVAGLLLARGLSRSREFAIRSSLGAGRLRIGRQLLTESLVLGVLGGVVGCVLAGVLLRVFKALAPTTIPHIEDMSLNASVLVFALAASVCSGVLFGFAAAFPLTRLTRSHSYIRQILVAGQLAISLVLLCGSGLLLESLYRVQHVAYGLTSDHVLVADLSLAFKRHPNAAARQQFIDTLLERMRAIPGTSAVAFTDTVPPSGFVHDRPFTNFVVNGRRVQVDGTGGMVAWRSVTPEYFHTLGIHTLNGRTFNEQDRSSKDELMVISHLLARRLFPQQNAIGASIRPSPEGPVYRVAAVVSDVRNSGLAPAQLVEYYVLRKHITDPEQGRNADIMSRAVHFYDGQGSIILRSSGRQDLVTSSIREQLRQLDPTTPVTINTLDERLSVLQEGPRFSTALLCGFAAVGLLLAAAGLYGLVSYLVAQRRKEIGLRFALGATRQHVIGLVLKHAFHSALPGILVGLILAFATTRWFEGLLFEVQARNPGIFAAAALALFLVVILASLVPSWRGAQVDPASVLRQD